MRSKVKISEVKLETVNDYAIALGSWFTVMAGIIFTLSLYFIQIDYEKSILNEIQKNSLQLQFLENKEVL